MKHFKSNLAKPILYLSIFLGAWCFRIETANSHGLSVFAWVEGDTIFVESKFSGGKRVNAGKIIVTDSQGTELLTGTTDENGEFSFKVPKKTELKIVLLAGTGHRAEWTIAAGEIEMPAAEKKPVPEKSSTLRSIIIGIGCIFSLTGITAYIRKRKKKNETMKTQKSKS